MNVLPWHQSAWQRLVEARRQGRLAHAYIVHARPGYGRDDFARAWVAGLLCTQPQDDGRACGICTRCGWVQAHSHPDILEVHPSGASETITVDAIREANDFIILSAEEKSWKTVLIFQAERLNTFAANSLLKTLEEPPARGLLLLLCETPAALLATLRSRCQFVDVGRCDIPTAQAWLKPQVDCSLDPLWLLGLAQGAPLSALELAQPDVLELRQQVFREFDALLQRRSEPLAIAATWMTRDVVTTLRWLRAWYVDMIRLALAPHAPVLNQDWRETLAAVVRRRPVARLFVDYDSLCQALRLQRTNVNTQLVLEDLLCRLI